MLKSLLIVCFFLLSASAHSLEVSVEALARNEEVSADFSAEAALSLNGYRQIITRELDALKLDPTLYWTRLDKKKLTAKEESLFLKNFFSDETLTLTEKGTAENAPLSATLKANLDVEKLKQSYIELTNDLEEAKLRTLYLVPEIELSSGMTWEDVGVTKAQNFSDVIVGSWKKNFEKELKGIEKVVVLEKDLSVRPDFMNDKSMTLKWKSLLKKVASSKDNQSAQFSLSAQYILQKTKEQTLLTSFDFPEQKRTMETENKKLLSSKLASLIYNLLYSETAKISGLAESVANTTSFAPLEVKVTGKFGILDVSLLNSFLQEKLSALKLSSQMKSISPSEATLVIKAEVPNEKILEALANLGERPALNEQKILLFNRADKTFAILPKETNN